MRVKLSTSSVIAILATVATCTLIACGGSSGQLTGSTNTTGTTTGSTTTTGTTTGSTATGGGTGGNSSLVVGTLYPIANQNASDNNPANFVNWTSLNSNNAMVLGSGKVYFLSAYNASPVLLNFNVASNIEAATIATSMNVSNQILGVNLGTNYVESYFSSPSSTAAPIASLNLAVASINDNGLIAGSATPSATFAYGTPEYVGYLYSSALATPTQLYPVGATSQAVGNYTVITHGLSNVEITNVTDADKFNGYYFLTGSPNQAATSATVVNGVAKLNLPPGGRNSYSFTLTPSLNGVAGTPIQFTVQIGDEQSGATSINNSGDIVGGTWLASQDNFGSPLRTPAYWAAGSANAVALSDPENREFNNLMISNGSQISGTTTSDLSGNVSSSVAVYWSSPTATPVDLPLLSGYTDEVVTGINSSGIVSGFCFNSSGKQEAVIWKNGIVIDLKTLVLNTYTGTIGEATAINDLDVVVGEITNPDNTTHAFILKFQ